MLKVLTVGDPKETLPPLEYLRECFILVDTKQFAVLLWRHRPEHHFSRPQTQVSINKQFAHRIAGNLTAGTRNYYEVGIDNVTYLVHRVIWKMRTGFDPGELQVDHINGDGTCNTSWNMRLVPHKINAKNTSIPINNTSGVIGISYDKSRRKWAAYIKVDGRKIGLGRHELKQQAIKARRQAERKYGFHENHGRKAA